jgi:carbon storage regulator
LIANELRFREYRQFGLTLISKVPYNLYDEFARDGQVAPSYESSCWNTWVGRGAFFVSRRLMTGRLGTVPFPVHGGMIMLVLTRQVGEEIVINGNVRVSIVAVKGGKVRLGITAPPEVPVDRKEVHDRRPAFEAPADHEPLAPVV